MNLILVWIQNTAMTIGNLIQEIAEEYNGHHFEAAL
jgi:hypothetical protein